MKFAFRPVEVRKVFNTWAAAGFLIAGALNARASLVIWSGSTNNSSSGQPLEATATFDLVGSGTELQITLTNGGGQVLVPSDILTALYFDGPGLTNLTPVSAVLGPGSALANGPMPSGETLGDEWAYQAGISGGHGATRGISASGIQNTFTVKGNFGSNGQNLDGYGYGLINSGTSAGNGQIPNTIFERDSMVFTLSGLPTGFNVNSITNVSFQYGTMSSEPLVGATLVPEPSAFAILIPGAAALAAFRRKLER